MGLGPSLPPAELARRDSALSGKWNAYFLLRRMKILGGWHIGARVEKLEVKTEEKPASLKWPDAGSRSTGRWCLRPVTLTGGTEARVYHRTLGYVRSRWTGRVWSRRNGFWPLVYSTGCWGSSVRSVLPECPVSFIAVEIWRTAFEASDAWRPSVDRTLSLGSDQFDRSVRSERSVPSEGVQRLYFVGASI